MQQNTPILTKEYEVNSLLIDASKNLSLVGLLGILQDIAGEQAAQFGFGYEDLKQQSFYWVLVRQKLKMYQWPQWHEVVSVQTWAKSPTAMYANREFELFLGEEKVGECSTTWVILDAETKRPKRIDNAEELYHVRNDYSLDFTAGKIRLPKEMISTNVYEARYSDLDMNQHVNNIKYSQWVLDSLPSQYLEQYTIREYEVNFSGETFLGDRIECSSAFEKETSQDTFEASFQLNKIDGSKSVFTAQMKGDKKMIN